MGAQPTPTGIAFQDASRVAAGDVSPIRPHDRRRPVQQGMLGQVRNVAILYHSCKNLRPAPCAVSTTAREISDDSARVHINELARTKLPDALLPALEMDCDRIPKWSV